MESRKAPEDEKPLNDTNLTTRDTSRHDEYENVANPQGPGDETEVTGQDGRNVRGFGGIDMDSENGVIRMGDMDNSTMEVTDEAMKSVAGSDAQTNTSTVSVTTSGPDDYASAEQVAVPKAQETAKQQDDDDSTDANDSDSNAAVSQEEVDEDVAETGTSIDHQPAY